MKKCKHETKAVKHLATSPPVLVTDCVLCGVRLSAVEKERPNAATVSDADINMAIEDAKRSTPPPSDIQISKRIDAVKGAKRMWAGVTGVAGIDGDKV